MSLTNDIVVALTAKAEAIAEVRATYPWAPDGIAATPAVVVGAHRAVYTVGDREVREYTFPLQVWVARTADDARTQEAVNELVDQMVDAYGAGVTLSEVTGASCFARIAEWRTDQWAEKDGGGAYQIAEFTYLVTTRRAMPTLSA